MSEQSHVTSTETADIHTLRVGYPDRANLMPLLYGLQAGWVGPPSPWKLEVTHAVPRALTTGLLDGTLDAAFVPPLALSGGSSQLASLGGWGLASEGISETARLLAPQRLDLMDGGTLALSPEVEGSTVEHLLRLLLKPYYDITLSITTSRDAGYDAKGMRLLYNDDAAGQAQKKLEAWVAEDMGVAWYVLSGLPLVWEIAAVSRSLETRKPGATEVLNDTLKLSQNAAREQQATVLEEAARRLDLKRDQVKELFARQRYTLGDREQKGLAHFFTLAAQNGVLQN